MNKNKHNQFGAGIFLALIALMAVPIAQFDVSQMEPIDFSSTLESDYNFLNLFNMEIIPSAHAAVITTDFRIDEVTDTKIVATYIGGDADYSRTSIVKVPALDAGAIITKNGYTTTFEGLTASTDYYIQKIGHDGKRSTYSPDYQLVSTISPVTYTFEEVSKTHDTIVVKYNGTGTVNNYNFTGGAGTLDATNTDAITLSGADANTAYTINARAADDFVLGSIDVTTEHSRTIELINPTTDGFTINYIGSAPEGDISGYLISPNDKHTRAFDGTVTGLLSDKSYSVYGLFSDGKHTNTASIKTLSSAPTYTIDNIVPTHDSISFVYNGTYNGAIIESSKSVQLFSNVETGDTIKFTNLVSDEQYKIVVSDSSYNQKKTYLIDTLSNTPTYTLDNIGATHNTITATFNGTATDAKVKIDGANAKSVTNGNDVSFSGLTAEKEYTLTVHKGDEVAAQQTYSQKTGIKAAEVNQHLVTIVSQDATTFTATYSGAHVISGSHITPNINSNTDAATPKVLTFVNAVEGTEYTVVLYKFNGDVLAIVYYTHTAPAVQKLDGVIQITPISNTSFTATYTGSGSISSAGANPQPIAHKVIDKKNVLFTAATAGTEYTIEMFIIEGANPPMKASKVYTMPAIPTPSIKATSVDDWKESVKVLGNNKAIWKEAHAPVKSIKILVSGGGGYVKLDKDATEYQIPADKISGKVTIIMELKPKDGGKVKAVTSFDNRPAKVIPNDFRIFESRNGIQAENWKQAGIGGDLLLTFYDRNLNVLKTETIYGALPATVQDITEEAFIVTGIVKENHHKQYKQSAESAPFVFYQHDGELESDHKAHTNNKHDDFVTEAVPAFGARMHASPTQTFGAAPTDALELEGWNAFRDAFNTAMATNPAFTAQEAFDSIANAPAHQQDLGDGTFVSHTAGQFFLFTDSTGRAQYWAFVSLTIFNIHIENYKVEEEKKKKDNDYMGTPTELTEFTINGELVDFKERKSTMLDTPVTTPSSTVNFEFKVTDLEGDFKEIVLYVEHPKFQHQSLGEIVRLTQEKEGHHGKWADMTAHTVNDYTVHHSMDVRDFDDLIRDVKFTTVSIVENGIVDEANNKKGATQGWSGTDGIIRGTVSFNYDFEGAKLVIDTRDMLGNLDRWTVLNALTIDSPIGNWIDDYNHDCGKTKNTADWKQCITNHKTHPNERNN